LEDAGILPVGYQFAKYHMGVDVEDGSYRHKARFLVGGQISEAPSAITYACVVSIESKQTWLLLVALHDLKMFAADIYNECLTRTCTDKRYTILGEEFSHNRNKKKSIVVRALYGRKSAGAPFRNHLVGFLVNLGFTWSSGGPDVWFWSAQTRNYREHYEYLLVYTYDIMAIGLIQMIILMKLNKYFKHKPYSIHPTENYLLTIIK
jgi:hypothetical protein